MRAALAAQRQGIAGAAQAAEEGGTPHYPLVKPVEQDWSFAGPFGTYDRGQLQRGRHVPQIGTQIAAHRAQDPKIADMIRDAPASGSPGGCADG